MLTIKLTAHALIAGVGYEPGDVITHQADEAKKRSLVEHGKATWHVPAVEVAAARPVTEEATAAPRRRVRAVPAGGDACAS